MKSEKGKSQQAKKKHETTRNVTEKGRENAFHVVDSLEKSYNK